MNVETFAQQELPESLSLDQLFLVSAREAERRETALHAFQEAVPEFFLANLLAINFLASTKKILRLLGQKQCSL